jgi:hypothetical protein
MSWCDGNGYGCEDGIVTLLSRTRGCLVGMRPGNAAATRSNDFLFDSEWYLPGSLIIQP